MLQTYFSKPVSSDISKKVSKNGSLNVSLGDDKWYSDIFIKFSSF